MEVVEWVDRVRQEIGSNLIGENGNPSNNYEVLKRVKMGFFILFKQFCDIDRIKFKPLCPLFFQFLTCTQM